MPIVSDDGIHETEFEAVLHALPLPPELKRVYITGSDPEVIKPVDPGDDKMVVTPNELTRGKELDDAELNPSTGLGIDIKDEVIRPEPYGLNPPERGPGFAGPPKPEPKILYKTKSGVEITDQDIDAAINVVTSFGAGTMAGVKAMSIEKLKSLQLAQTMESNARHPDLIFKDTGMFRGADTRWRYEIPDKPAKMVEGWDKIPEKPSWSKVQPEPVTRKLTDVLEHPELYKAYPELSKVKVKVDPNYEGVAVFEAEQNLITINPANAKKHNWTSKEVILHEIQHKIQSHEGFAQGGSVAELKLGDTEVPYVLKHQLSGESIQQTRDYLNYLLKKYNNTGKLTPAEIDDLGYYGKLLGTHEKYLKAGNIEAYKYYEQLAGEVESRNVQFRSELDPEVAKTIPPIMTEDIPRFKQIVREEPSWTTAYGALDTKTGKYIKPSK